MQPGYAVASLLMRARSARITRGKASLLSTGVVRVERPFAPMDVVSIANVDGNEFARGVANCASEAAATTRVLFTRDNIVLLEQEALSDDSRTRPATDVASIAHSAREASRKLALLSDETRKATLLAIAEALEGNAGRILAANAKDCAASGKALIHRRDDASPVFTAADQREWHR